MDILNESKNYICKICQDTKDFSCPLRNHYEYCDKCNSYACIITITLSRGGFIDEYDN